jgi:hypothetical protein
LKATVIPGKRTTTCNNTQDMEQHTKKGERGKKKSNWIITFVFFLCKHLYPACMCISTAIRGRFLSPLFR